jgi:hypothetical protein
MKQQAESEDSKNENELTSVSNITSLYSNLFTKKQQEEGKVGSDADEVTMPDTSGGSAQDRVDDISNLIWDVPNTYDKNVFTQEGLKKYYERRGGY